MTAGLRTRVRDEIIARLKAQPDLADVKIDPGDPGKNLERKHVYVAGVTGRRDFVFLEAGRKTVEDNFTITIVFSVFNPGETTFDADDGVEIMSMCLLDVVADDPSLGDLAGLMWVGEGESVGPLHVLTEQGAIGEVRTTVECKARYV